MFRASTFFLRYVLDAWYICLYDICSNIRFNTHYFVRRLAHGILFVCAGIKLAFFCVVRIASSGDNRCQHALIVPRLCDTHLLHQRLLSFRVHGRLVLLLPAAAHGSSTTKLCFR